MKTDSKLSAVTGTAVVVSFLPPAPGVTPSADTAVTVRGIARADWAKARRLLDSDGGLIELCCGMPAGWAATVTDGSFVELLAAVEKEAASFFAYCAVRARRDLMLQPPEVLAQILATVRESMSPSPSPTSPSPAT